MPGKPMSAALIAIITDAWAPQVNGVVNTLNQTRRSLDLQGHRVTMLTPQDHRTFPCPTYPEIRLSFRPYRAVADQLAALTPDHIHIATEGPLGQAARRYCLCNGLAFTTSYHTRFPEYIRKRVPIPLAVSYAFMRRFHNAARHTMVATPGLERLLKQWDFIRIARWSRGVDTTIFTPEEREPLTLKRPLFAYAGRVAVEKNLDAFLQLELPGSKCIIGAGPDLAELRRRYPEVLFAGYRFGRELSRFIAAADVFVFPSLTDTFGLVMLEAMACGVPVAAFPVTGPVDVVTHEETGFLDMDLRRAALAALELSRERCREEALKHTWEMASKQFLANLVPASAV
jgi:1,2-diacylglycerol 3-alpha-glucosyltransferase/glucuronosyltransferase